MVIDGAPHYPYVTRMVAGLFAEGALSNVVDVEIEPEYGYVTRIHYANGTYRTTRGNDVGLNSGAAQEVVKDKAHTKFFLRRSGVPCARGESFLLPWWARRIRPRMESNGHHALRTVDAAAEYVRDNTGFPVYVKPVDGSKGINVWRVSDEAELAGVFAAFEEERVRVALVEEAIDLPDYRLVVLDGKLISAYRRNPLAVVGDGASTVAELMSRLQESYSLGLRDTVLRAGDARIGARLRRDGRTLRSVPETGERVRLLDISNLSAGGTADDVTGIVAERWVTLAVTVAGLFNLRFCGVDLACSDIASDEGTCAVIEVNGTPGLDHYVSTGATQEAIVRKLYLEVLNVPPRED
ncbi:Cyanophycin synthase [Actinokineospora spheciospongiae]|uniref:Cyanophycin synthase n=1 Tax=Actinokineospora spheciospongiae TaxID=909613 RepID=W7IKJ4_9PSEU|nr:hypothetical protein [Actinokineospora spheciospongiae]EWC60853.1 Cyanophycin synthase [Actinokineospora spheciospongiae]